LFEPPEILGQMPGNAIPRPDHAVEGHCGNSYEGSVHRLIGKQARNATVEKKGGPVSDLFHGGSEYL
jgi:hypothetical protein